MQSSCIREFSIRLQILPRCSVCIRVLFLVPRLVLDMFADKLVPFTYCLQLSSLRCVWFTCGLLPWCFYETLMNCASAVCLYSLYILHVSRLGNDTDDTRTFSYSFITVTLTSIFSLHSVPMSFVSQLSTVVQFRCKFFLRHHVHKQLLSHEHLNNVRRSNKKLCCHKEATWCFMSVSVSFNCTICRAQCFLLVTLGSDLPLRTIRFCSVVFGVTSSLAVIHKIQVHRDCV